MRTPRSSVDVWRWRWRLALRRARRDLLERPFYTSPRVAYAVVVAAWVAGLLLGLVGGTGGVLARLEDDLLTTALISAVAGIVLYLGSNERLARRLRANACSAPEDLLQGEPRPTLRPGPGSRASLFEELTTALTEVPPVGAQLIVGETGSGKTSALVDLAAYLAERGMVPVIVSMRGSASLDFLGLAHDALAAQLEAQVGSVDEAERLWRWLRRSGRLVVLADDLDEASTTADGDPPDSYAIRRALETERRRETPLVVTSRPVGVPGTLAGSAVSLDPLDPAEASRQVAAASPRLDPTAVEAVTRLVEVGRLGEVPFYLEATTALARSARLPTPASSDPVDVRLALLEAYEQALAEELVVTDASVGPDERRRTIDAFSAVALRELATPTTDLALARVIEHVTRAAPDRDPLRIVDAAERLRIVVRRQAGTLRFRHQIVQSYLASRLLVDRRAELRRACAHAHAPRALNALLMAAVRSGDDVRVHVGDCLLRAARERSGDWGLVLVTVAAEVARFSGDSALQDRAAQAAMDYAPADEPRATTAAADAAARPHTRRALIPRLAALEGDEAQRTLWHFTADPDWVVKWDAAEALCTRAARAHAVLTNRFDGYLADAIRQLVENPRPSRLDDWKDRGPFQLKMLAWVLPSLATALERAGDAAAAAATDRQWDTMRDLQLAPITCQLGLEAAMSQGLKADATRTRLSEQAPARRLEIARSRALDMLATAEFWFTRIQLVHTLALIDGGPEIRARLERIAAGKRDPEPAASPSDACFDGDRPPGGGEHEFTREAARLALAALDDGDWRPRIWSDEGVVVSGRSNLSDAAAQLAADIAVVLNLNEQGGETQRLRFGYRSDLPACIATSKTRDEITGKRGSRCLPECPFSLCPSHRADTEGAHRELSRAFCRQQAQLAARRTPSWSPIEKPRLREFWRAMEQRARI